MKTLLMMLLACAVLVPATRAAAAEETKVAEHVYKKTPQGELKMFVHLPADSKPADKRPAIVFFFGGGWKSGTVEQFRPQAEYLASRGMVAARADYRVQSRHGTTPDKCVEDAKSAVRWLRQHAAELGIDTDRIVAAGGSAGGHIAACAGMTDTLDAKDEDKAVSSRPNAMVLFNPVLDLTDLPLGVADVPDLAKSMSPIRYAAKNTPPMILFYGTTDKFCAQGRAMLAKAKEVGFRCELFTAEGMPHGFFNKAPWTEITLRQADAFLASLGYLKGEPTVKAPAGAKETLKREQ
jgi:acetyl esterase/lipase